MKKTVLVVGGAGYIGSHMVRKLLDRHLQPVVFDNLSSGQRRFVPKGVKLHKGDMKRPRDLAAAFRAVRPDTVMHFAGSSLVGESIYQPLKYYENNVSNFVHLLEAAVAFKVKKIIFSSSAAVYGEPSRVPIKEEDMLRPTNPYGRSKMMMEAMLADTGTAHGISHASLRYFNACGADKAGGIGEAHEPETHLIPNVLHAAQMGAEILVFGNDYKTKDGTCVRDYVHVSDLAEAHLLALEALERGLKKGIFNLGSGSGYSVLEVIRTAEKVIGKKIRVKVAPRRPGDPATLVASSSRAAKLLGWKPKLGLEEMIDSAWAWEKSR